MKSFVALLLLATLALACNRPTPEPAAAAPSPATTAAETPGAAATAETQAGADSEASPASADAAPAAAPAPTPAPAAGGHPAQMGSDHAPAIDVPESEIVRQPGAAVGDATRCPVSGEAFRVTETSASVDHEGQQVFFCCGSCARPFLRNPEQYLSAGDTEE